MYTLLNAVAKPSGIENRWVNIDIGSMKMVDLFKQYRRVYAVLSNPFIPNKVTLDIEDIRHQFGVSNLTFNEVLTQNGNKNLPTSNKVPSLANKYVRYRDCFMAGYKVKPVNRKKAPDANIPRGDKESLYLTKTGLDCRQIKDHCMISVNGYFHYVDADANGAWVIDGMKSNLICKDNLIGLYSFKDLGKLKYIDIKKEMIFKLSEDSAYRYQMGIDVGESIDDKTVILVLGGYMHVLNNQAYYQYNDTCIMINTARLPLLQRYHESRRYLDLSSMPFTISGLNESVVNISDYLSDENLMAYLELSQSFIVLLDNKEIYAEKHYIRTPPTPALMISFDKADMPLFHGVGKVANYWPVEDHGQYAIHLDDNQWSRLHYETISPNLLAIVGDSEQTQKPVELSDGYFLKIGTDIQLK